MSNTFQIKRGSSIPTTSQLAEYELGFNTTNNTLYINNGTEVVVPFSRVNLPDASLTTGGIVNISNQTFAGSKKFQATVAIGGYKSSSSSAEYGAIAFRTPSQIDTNNETAMIVVSGGITSDGKNGEPRFQFIEYSKLANGTEGEHSTSAKPFYNFRLPAVPQGLTSSTTYDILTTKNLITIAQGGTGAATAAINTVFAGPSSGSTAAPSFRILIAADIPDLNASKITAGTFDVARIPNLAASKITSGTLAVTQGGTGLSSLETFVRTTGAQTITGAKTFSNNIQLSAVNVGIYAKDSGDNSYAIICNNSANLWIGAGSSTSVHHMGSTYISTGIDSNGVGNDSIHISVPTRSGSADNYTFTATKYDVWSTKTLKIQHGFATISTTAPSSNNITYSGFTAIPKIFATYNIDATSISGDNTGDKGAIKIYNISTSGCKAVIGGSATTSMRIAWVAIGT